MEARNIKEILNGVNTFKKIKLRYRDTKSGLVLYLDFSNGSQRHRETLDIILNPDDLDENLIQLAISIRDKKELDYLQNKYDVNIFKDTITLGDYFSDLMKRKTKNWVSVYNQIKSQYIGRKNIGEISHQDCVAFSVKLLDSLKPTTANAYFGIFKSCLYNAVIDGKINKNPAKNVSIKADDVRREFLTEEEIKLLVASDCKKNVKDAFLFSCFTGLRFSDVCNITPGDVKNDQIHIIQKKTKSIVRIPIHPNAKRILEQYPNGFNLPALPHVLERIKDWTSGIGKHITFHSARHTFATLLITNGADIYTVSKLLGHKSIQNTQIYAQMVDQRKIDTVGMLPSIKS